MNCDTTSTHRLTRLLSLTLWCGVLLFGSACKKTSDQTRQNASVSFPVLATVPAFSLTSQDNRPFGSEQLRGTPYIAAFMFTRCPSICPRLTATMKKVDVLLTKEGVSAHLISISVDPAFDTPPVLAEYARKHAIDTRHWTFLTGEHSVIASTAEQGFKVGLSGSLDEKQPHLGITHASHLILVDAQGAIRGYFRSSDDDVAEQVLRAMRTISS
ncbi:MAG TPA: SCO family protein [Polyangiaceae bacterium]|nr:SCO family protein [Polyangiaceae bacterium]